MYLFLSDKLILMIPFLAVLDIVDGPWTTLTVQSNGKLSSLLTTEIFTIEFSLEKCMHVLIQTLLSIDNKLDYVTFTVDLQ